VIVSHWPSAAGARLSWHASSVNRAFPVPSCGAFQRYHGQVPLFALEGDLAGQSDTRLAPDQRHRLRAVRPSRPVCPWFESRLTVHRTEAMVDFVGQASRAWMGRIADSEQTITRPATCCYSPAAFLDRTRWLVEHESSRGAILRRSSRDRLAQILEQQHQVEFVYRGGLEPEFPVETLGTLVLCMNDDRTQAGDFRGLKRPEQRVLQ
jgi:hypothetical protein